MDVDVESKVNMAATDLETKTASICYRLPLTISFNWPLVLDIGLKRASFKRVTFIRPLCDICQRS